MNIKKIKKSTSIMAVGYIFIVISLFYILVNVGLKYASLLVFFMIPGYALLTIGEGKVRKENKMFRASFIVSLFMDLTYVIYVFIGIYNQFNELSAETIENIEVILLILQALLNAFVAITSCLYADGLKQTFIKLNNKTMSVYSWIMKFSVSKLIILLVALPTIKITSISAVLITTLTIIVVFLIETSLLVFSIICSLELRENKVKKQDLNKA